jgi:hypothetical protein
LLTHDHVIRSVEEIAMQQRLGQALAVVGRAHFIAEPLESLALVRSDLRVDRVEERECRHEVLTRAALAAGIISGRATGAADGPIEWEGVQPSEQVTHDGELLAALVSDGHGERPAGDESGDEDGRVVAHRHRVVGREPLQEPQDRGIAFDAGSWARRRERARNPRVAVAAVNAKDVIMVVAGLRRGDRIDAVMILEMGVHTLTDRLVKHPGLELFKVGERFGIALTRFLSVAAGDLLETAVLGHGQASSLHPRPPATRY